MKLTMQWLNLKLNVIAEWKCFQLFRPGRLATCQDTLERLSFPMLDGVGPLEEAHFPSPTPEFTVELFWSQ